MNNIIFVIIAVAIISCTEEKSKPVFRTQEEVKESIAKAEPLIKKIAEGDIKGQQQRETAYLVEEPAVHPDSVSLGFKEIELTVGLEEVWTEKNYLEMVNKDTIRIEMGLASKISGHVYSISNIDSSVHEIKVLQNYETSLTLMNEGPHIDLTEWKHYYSDWIDLRVEDKAFTTIDYPIEDWIKFPEVTTGEIVEAVKEKLDGESGRWVELAQKCKGANEYPCGVSISRITLRIIMTDNDGKRKEKVIIYEMPMGC